MDVVGSTRLSQRLDPEDIHAIMDTALERLTSIVDAHEGRVLQYAGDSLLAVFGADQARRRRRARRTRRVGDHRREPRRLRPISAERYHADGFGVRVGIHTGPVLLGGGVAADGSIRGITVNIAARMEQTAPPGALRISHETYRHVRGVFDVEAQPPLEIKGITAPVRSYLVLRAKPRAFRMANRGLEGVEARMIGRDADLNAHHRSVPRRMREQEPPTQVTIVGEPGIGKSRLGLEFTHWLESLDEPACASFRAAPTRTATTSHTACSASLLAWRFEILESDTPSIAQRKLAAGLAPALGAGATEYAALIGELIGFEYRGDPHVAAVAGEARQIRNRAFHALAWYFRALHRDSGTPVVLILDDLHWADEGSLDFVDHLVQSCRRSAAVQCCA